MLARTRVTQFEWATGDSLRLAKIPILDDNRSPASAAAAQSIRLPEEIFRQLFLILRPLCPGNESRPAAGDDAATTRQPD